MMADPDDNLQQSPEAEFPDEEPFIIVDDEAADETDFAAATPSAEDELDGMRIRNLVHMRRANIRSQTYGIVGVVVCAVASVKLVLMAYQRYVIEQWTYCGAFAAAAIASAIGALMFAAHVDRVRSELRRPPDESKHNPEFEMLSDGSHHIRNLEDMHSQ